MVSLKRPYLPLDVELNYAYLGLPGRIAGVPKSVQMCNVWNLTSLSVLLSMPAKVCGDIQSVNPILLLVLGCVVYLLLLNIAT